MAAHHSGGSTAIPRTRLARLQSRHGEEVEDHGGFITTSQVVMNLTDLHFLFHCYNGYCDFREDLEDLTPEGYEPKIKITISMSDD